MTGPGGPEVGRVSVRVVPDTSGFDDALRKKLNAIEKTEELKIPVKFDVDQTQLEEELQKIRVHAIGVPVEPDFTGFTTELNNRLRAIKPTTVKVPAEPNLVGFATKLNDRIRAIRPTTIRVPAEPNLTGFSTELNARLRALSPTPVKVGARPDLTGFRTALRAQLATVNTPVRVPIELRGLAEIAKFRAALDAIASKDIAISVNLKGVLQATAQLEYLFSLVSLLDGKRINMTVDVDGLAAAVTQLGGLRVIANDAGRQLGGAGKTASREFGKLNGTISNILGGLVQVVALAPVIVVAGAGIAAAWGAASTAIAAIPGLIAGAAAVIGTVVVGMDGIKKAAKTIKPEFDKLKKSVSDTFERGMIPVFKQLATTFPTLTTGMNRVATAITGIAARLVDMVASQAGLTRIRSIFDGVADALDKMAPGVAALVDSFLILGSQSVIFDTLASAVNTFGQEFRSSVIDLIESGTLDRAMVGLRGSLEALSRGFVSLVNNGIKLFASAAPGVNQFLNSLTAFFNRFNWDSLGASVGRVFSGLAESLDGVDDQTIKDIEQAFSDLGDTFKDPEFQKNLDNIIRGLPGAIRQLGELSKAFAEVGSTISGVIQKLDELDQKVQPVIQGFYESADKLRRLLAGGLGLDQEDPLGLKAFEDNFSLDLVIVGIELGFNRITALFNTGMGVIAGIWNRGWGLLSGAVGLSWAQITGVVGLGWAQIQAQFTLGMAAIQTAWDLGWASLTTAVQLAWTLIPTYVQLGLATVTTTLTTGLGLIKTAWDLAWLQFGTTVQIAMALIPTYVQIGITAIQTAMTTGLALIKVGWDLAWLQLGTTVQIAMALIPTYIQTGMTLSQTAVATGMTLIQTAVSTGWAQVQTLTSIAWAQVQSIISLAWGVITGDTQTGATNTQSAVDTAWSQITAITSTAWETIKTTIATACAEFVTSVQTAASDVVTEMSALPGKITGALGNLGSLLVAAGRSLIDGLLSGIKAGVDAMLSYVSGIAARIAAVKGPRQVDRTILQPAGQWLMQGLEDGLRDGMAIVRRLVARFTGEFGTLTFDAPELANMQQFVNAGQAIGDALTQGLLAQRAAIIAAARDITDQVSAQFENVDAGAVNTALDDVNARLHSGANRSTAELNTALAGKTTTAGKAVEIVQNFNVPSAEQASDKALHGMRRLSAMGMFA